MRRFVLCALVLLLPASVAHAVPVILQYGTTVDLLNQEIAFFITFDGPVPSLTDGNYRMEIDVTPDSLAPGSGYDVTPPFFSFTLNADTRVLSCGIGGSPNGGDYPECSTGLFGSIDGGFTHTSYGTTPLSLIGPTLSFTAPFAMVNESDGIFTYEIEDAVGQRGRLRSVLFGTSGQTYTAPAIPAAAPEPATLALLAIGGVVGCWRRRA